MSGQLLDRAKAEGEERVRAVAKRIAQTAPRLADLGPAELEKIARAAVVDELRAEMKRATDVERVDVKAEWDRYARGLGSEHTAKAYRAAFDRLVEYSEDVGVPLAAFGPKEADDWIAELKGSGRAPASVRLDASAASAFFSWLERRHRDAIRNPFRGTRERPKLKARRKLAVPSPDAIGAMVAAAAEDPVLRAAVVVMAELGVRVGALPTFAVSGSTWRATSKGKEHRGPTPETRAAFDRVRAELERLGLSLRAPFDGLSAAAIADRVRRLVARLVDAGELEHDYSAHDLRHAHAVALYTATHDLYAVSRSLGHASVAVTQRYLRSLELVD